MKRSIQLSFLILLIQLFPLSATAQNQYNLNSLEEGQILLNISATESVEVDQDTLNITLSYITTGEDRTDLQNEVNSVMASALEILEDSSGIDYSIQRYQVYMTNPDPRSNRNTSQQWRAQQSVQLTSLNSDAILDLANILQEIELVIQNMYYSLSTTQYETVSDSLLGAALDKLQARADAAADSMGKASADLVEVTVNNSGGGFFQARPEMRAMSDSASMARPVAQPGKTQVSLTVSARALLSP